MALVTWRLDEHPADLSYNLLSGLIVPRPIAFVSTVDPQGVPNLAPFSFFMCGGAKPPSLAFCPILDRSGMKKTTLRNIEATQEFVVNLVDRRMAKGMNTTGVDYVEEVSKWGISGFTHVESLLVRPDRVAESPAQFECRLHQCVTHGESTYVVGEVLVAHVSEALIDRATGKSTGFRPIARLGGAEYIDVDGGKVFEMTRPNPDSPPSVDR